MSVRLEFLNLIVPISRIEKKYPGGMEGCLKDLYHLIGNRVWFDNKILRDGAMDPVAMQSMLAHWKNLGFRTHKGGKNPVQWLDVCVVDTYSEAPTLPCDWITVSDGVAKLSKDQSEIIVGPEHFYVGDGSIWRKVADLAE